MKKIMSLCLISLLLWSSVAFAAAGDVVSDKYNAIWQIAASGLSGLLTKMDGLPDAYQATQSMTEWATWIRLEYAQSASLGKVFPIEVYSFLLGRFIGYNYGSTSVNPSFAAPSCTGGVGQITCDEDTVQIPTGRDVLCYSWNFVDFTELAAGALATGTWTFSGLSAGYYVCAFSSTFDALPTTYITVTE